MSTTTTITATAPSASPDTDAFADNWTSQSSTSQVGSSSNATEDVIHRATAANEQRAYIAIDLTAYAGLTATGGSHTFSFYIDNAGQGTGPAGTLTYSFGASATRPFTESTLTWANQPAVPSLFTATTPGQGTSTAGYQSFTITDAQMQQLLGKWVLIAVQETTTGSLISVGLGSRRGSPYSTTFTTIPPSITTAQTFYPTSAAIDQTLSGANVIKGVDSVVPIGASTTTATYTTTTANQVITLIPFTDNRTIGDTTSNNGWAFNNLTGAAFLESLATAQRVIPAGVWTFNLNNTLSIPALLATVSASFGASVYRVAAGGGSRTYLFGATSAAATNASATATATTTTQWFSTSQPAIVLRAGEVIEIGFGVVSQATANTVGTVTNTVVTLNTGGGTNVVVPSPGIRTFYARPITDGATISTDSTTRIAAHPRTLSESIPTTETPSRTNRTTRATSESMTTSETLTRFATFPRSMSETTSVSDALTRTVRFNKVLTESLTVSESVTRAITQTRSFTDSVTISELLAKVITYGRFTNEYPPGLIPDYPPIFGPFKAIAGYIRLRSNSDPNNIFTAGATVKLIRDNDNVLCQTTVSAADGSYYFARDKFDPYTYTVIANAVIAGSPQQDVTRKGLLPV